MENASSDSAAAAGQIAAKDRSAGRVRRLARWTLLLVMAVVAFLFWWSTRPLDTTAPEGNIHAVEPNQPLLSESDQQVTFILKDENGDIPSVFVFDSDDQKGTALGINTLRRTPDEQGVEIRFEAIRFRRDETDEDRLWVRAVGIANESEGKTTVSLRQLESGQPIDLRFHDEIKVPYVAHVIYEILMTMQYNPRTQQITLTNTTGSIRWKMFGSDAFDQGQLGDTILGQKGDYPVKPLLDF